MPIPIASWEIDLPDDLIEREIAAAFGETEEWLPPHEEKFRENSLLKGRVLRVTSDGVWVDVGYKSDGVIGLREWYDEDTGQILLPAPGDEIDLLLQSLEDESGAIVLSHRRARALAQWESFVAAHKEGDVVTATVTRKVKGGLLLDAGVSVFLPASQVDSRRPRDLRDYLGRKVQARIVHIDRARRNVVVSRRQFLEEQRAARKQQLLAEIQPGQVRKGVVKNITHFGAFIDLGGLDGLLHINDMSWGRVNAPQEVVRLDEEREVFVLRVDRDQERVGLSLKHLTPSPWEEVTEKYPVGSEHEGEVVHVTDFGAFVALAPGLVGLVHVSQWSHGRRVAWPADGVQRGDRLRCVVLDIDVARKRLSLGLKSDGNGQAG
jgi:small subunit ribosomal protein S1